ncbi:MAG: hypothetical protein KAY24_11415 [Candidatus Eisenbacteria sp.]|nr:hypothetical protein [Candidatus Eisenbacteria bacterium]
MKALQQAYDEARAHLRAGRIDRAQLCVRAASRELDAAAGLMANAAPTAAAALEGSEDALSTNAGRLGPRLKLRGARRCVKASEVTSEGLARARLQFDALLEELAVRIRDSQRDRAHLRERRRVHGLFHGPRVTGGALLDRSG